MVEWAATIFSIFVTIGFVVGFVLNPIKEHDDKNGYHQAVLGVIFFMIIAGAGAAVYTLLGVDVDLVSISLFVLAADAVLFFRIYHLKRIASLEWPGHDLVAVAVCVGVIAALSIWRFGFGLRLAYSDVDAARYVEGAVRIYTAKAVDGTYLTKLMMALAIDALDPVLGVISYYKAVIITHILMQLLGILMFYVLVSEVNEEKSGRYTNLIITLFYWAGFQLCNSTFGTFIQSMNGASVVMAMLYYVLRLQKGKISAPRGVVSLAVTGFGLIICYTFYYIMLIPILLPEAIIWLKNNVRGINVKIRAIGICCMVAMGTVGVVFASGRISSASHLGAALSVEGLAYKEPYQDFIFFIPILAFYTIWMIRDARGKRGENKSLFRMHWIAVAFIILWFAGYANGYISGYYYYRMYYILWMFAWITVADVIRIAAANGHVMALSSYGVLFGLAVISSVSGLNEKLLAVNEDIFLEPDTERDQVLCPLYSFNYDNVKGLPRSILSDAEFALYNEVIERGGMCIKINSYCTVMQTDWFLSMTAMEDKVWTRAFDVEGLSMEYILHNMDSYGYRNLTLEKDDTICMEYYDRIFSHVNVAYENEAGYIFEIDEGDSWLGILEEYRLDNDDLYELFYAACDEYSDQGTPVMVGEWEDYAEAFEYSLYAGRDAISYVGTIAADEFVASTYVFNNDDVQTMIVLKDSETYWQNREYFYSQEILMENSAGMIIRHAGTGWMPSEQ